MRAEWLIVGVREPGLRCVKDSVIKKKAASLMEREDSLNSPRKTLGFSLLNGPGNKGCSHSEQQEAVPSSSSTSASLKQQQSGNDTANYLIFFVVVF